MAATEVCYGFNHMGISAYRKKYCWNWAEPFVGDAEQVSGVIFVYNFFFPRTLALNFQKFLLDSQFSCYCV